MRRGVAYVFAPSNPTFASDLVVILGPEWQITLPCTHAYIKNVRRCSVREVQPKRKAPGCLAS